MTCFTCGAPIWRAETRGGKLVTLDPGPVPDGRVEVLSHSDRKTVVRVHPPDSPQVLFISYQLHECEAKHG